MKILLLILSLLLCGQINAKTLNNPINQSELNDDIQKNGLFIDKLNTIFMKNSMNIYYLQWQKIAEKKCNWVKANIDTKHYGQQDSLSDRLCMLTEQQAFINELITLIEQQNITLIPEKELNHYRSILVAQKPDNVYFNYLSDNFAGKFCATFYQADNKTDCMNRFLFYQYVPNNYGFKIIQPQADLFNQPLLTENTMESLKKDQPVTLLTRKNEFYYIEYKRADNIIINQWIHCSAIDAC